MEWLESTGRVLDRIGARWTAIGALAANEYRKTPRFTADADVLVEAVPRLEDALRADGYDVVVVRTAGEDPHLLRLTRGAAQVDVLLPVVEYQEVALGRAVDHVLTAEDVIVHKLLAWRPRDRDDIRSILEAGVALDDDYVTRWAAEWQVTDRWAQARRGG